MITSITGSSDLAEVLNAEPATEADAAETPRDWPGIWIGGHTYELDQDAATDTFAALADGTAAVRFKEAGADCWGVSGNVCGHRHGQPGIRREAHWVPADVETWTEEEDARGVKRDWRSVYVWDANGYSDTTVYDTLEEAKAAYAEAVADLKAMGEQYRAELAASE